jgi:hypothetical protein
MNKPDIRTQIFSSLKQYDEPIQLHIQHSTNDDVNAPPNTTSEGIPHSDEIDIINSRIDGLYDKIVNIEEILGTIQSSILNKVQISDLDPSTITSSSSTSTFSESHSSAPF